MTPADAVFDGGSRAVLFDLDGTLVDTAPDMVAILRDLQKARDMEPVHYAVARNSVSNGALGLIRLAFPHADEKLAATLHAEYLERYSNRLCVDSVVFPHLPELLSAMDDAARPWGVVTNKPERMTKPLMQQLGLLQRAACAVSGDTLETRKPDPAPLLHASALIGVAPESCVFVGDAARDIEAGRNAGMATIAVGYGYITDDDSPDSWGADRVVSETAELATLLAKAVNLST
ncbi:MAG: HAD-IA family hydrolase [Gammaproteobacteria bacterium]|nr:HAD-IA family hydrolase [Gammaproteobacteria bacterium]